MTALLAGLAFGLMGSGHCAAMCGPLVVLAAPPRAAHTRLTTAAWHVSRYHGGRALMYVVLGAVVGLAGGALVQAGLGRALAVFAGVLLVAQAVFATGLVSSRVASFGMAATVTRALGRATGWMRAHGLHGPVVFGALNGLLPCGFVYAALTAAVALGDPLASMRFMAGFALGTTPVLAAIGLAGGTLRTVVPHALRRAAPLALGVVGVLLIMRGVSGPHAGHTPHATAPAAASAHAAHQH